MRPYAAHPPAAVRDGGGERAPEAGAMTSTGAAGGTARPQQELDDLLDRAAIARLIDRYTLLLDSQDEPGTAPDWPRSIFTHDCRLVFPIGEHHGLAGLGAFHDAAKQKFSATHHLSSNHAIVLDGDRADIRFQMIATHVHRPDTRRRAARDPGPLFQVGGYYAGRAARTADGWRFASWSFHVVWTSGTGPADLD